ncbi:MAG: hypothetical protein RBR50_01120 [Candidatus Izemoplasmatales bacterium]|nr:hypothetical protein [Candidatus Izemoplasmatales bacterium]
MSNYENLILSSYFFNKYNNFNLSPLKENIFSTPFKRELIKKINHRLQTNKPLEVLEAEISQMLTNQTELHQEWLEIISAMPIHSQESLNEFIALVEKKHKQSIIRGAI